MNIRNRKGSRALAVVLALLMIYASMPAALAAPATAEKDENVYVNLNKNGSVERIYVVNAFEVESAGTITDYGDYQDTRNLSSQAAIEEDGTAYQVQAAEGKFYYQGTMKTTDTPWVINLSYNLDGKNTLPENLAGKSGHLVITISVRQNQKMDPAFFDNYLLQASVNLNENCKNIQAEGAAAANVGRDQQLLYNIMAGQEKEIVIQTDVVDFEMEGITFKGIPMSFDADKGMIDMSELDKKTAEISEAVAALDAGAGNMREGVYALSQGADTLDSSAAALAEGARSFDTSAALLSEKTDELVNGLTLLNKETAGLSSGASALFGGVSGYVDGARTLSQATGVYIQNAENLAEGTKIYVNAADQLAGSIAGLKQVPGSLENLQKGIDQAADEEHLSQLAAGSQALSSGLADLYEQTGDLGNLSGVSEKIDQLKSQMTAAGALVSTRSRDIEAANSTVGSLTEKLKNDPDAYKALTAEEWAVLEASLEAVDDDSRELLSVGEGIGQSASGIPDVSGLEALAGLHEAVGGLSTGAISLNAGITAQADGLSALKREADTSLPALASGVGQITSGAEAFQNSGSGQKLAEGADGLIDGGRSLSTAANTLAARGQELEKGAGDLQDGSAQLSEANQKAEEGGAQLSSAARQLSAGAKALSEGAGNLSSGSSLLAQGIENLKSGAGDMKDGTQAFSDKTQNIEVEINDQIDSAVDKLAGKNFKPVSFVSSQNQNIASVQFVMMTEAIKKQEEPAPEISAEKTGFWDKVTALFNKK